MQVSPPRPRTHQVAGRDVLNVVSVELVSAEEGDLGPVDPVHAVLEHGDGVG